MTDVKRDNNQIPAISGVLNSDGVTPTPIKANASNHGLSIDDNTTGSDLSGNVAKRDNNSVPGLLAVSEVDGATPILIYVTSAGKILIDST